jgi:hypothetical protein
MHGPKTTPLTGNPVYLLALMPGYGARKAKDGPGRTKGHALCHCEKVQFWSPYGNRGLVLGRVGV